MGRNIFRYGSRLFSRFSSSSSALDLASIHARGKGANGSSLILLHGLFGSKNNFRSLVKVLADRLSTNVYALDLRNHGQSPHDEVHDYSAMAGDVLHFIEKHELGKTALLGHSMGGKVVLTAALQRPELVSMVVSADMSTAVGPVGETFKKYIEAMRAIEREKVGKRSEADAILKEFEGSDLIRQFLLTNLVHHDDGHFIFRNPLDVIERSLDAIGDFPAQPQDPPRYQGPALFIKGARSKYLNKNTIKRSREFFPQMKLETLETGHWGAL